MCLRLPPAVPEPQRRFQALALPFLEVQAIVHNPLRMRSLIQRSGIYRLAHPQQLHPCSGLMPLATCIMQGRRMRAYSFPNFRARALTAVHIAHMVDLVIVR